MLDFNLEYYRAFYYAARTGSISRAAEALFLSQPAVSQSVRKLEAQLGCALFFRTSRGMQLTPRGELLLSHVSKAFDTLLEGEKTVRLSAPSGDLLRLGATETVLHHFLMPELERLRNIFPETRIHLEGSSTADILRLLSHRKIDLGFAVTPLPELAATFRVRILCTFQDVFMAGPSLSGNSEHRFTARELSCMPLAAAETGTSARTHLDHWFQSQGVLFMPEFSVRTTSQLLPLVEHQMAVGYMPEMFASSLEKTKKAFRLQTERPPEPRHMVMLWSEDPDISGACRQLMAQVSAVSG